LRAELADSADIAEAFLREATTEARMTERAVSNRLLGLTRLAQGRLEEAEANFEEALKFNNPERDRDAQVRFGIATGAVTATTLALVKRQLGKIEAGRTLVEKSIAEAIASGHPPTLVCAYYFKAQFEVLSDDCAAAAASAQSVIEISDQHGLAAFRPGGLLYRECSRARLAGRGAGPVHFQKATAARAAISDVEFRLWLPFYEGLLARLEAEQGETDAALDRIDAALALAAETGEHWANSLLLRFRGEFLLERDPENKSPAEEAFLAAIAVAREQRARVFELQAALSLARLYHSASRPSDAYDVLEPAMQGFSPSQEFPEIAEAQALLAAARADARL
jgi:predicted ATPase